MPRSKGAIKAGRIPLLIVDSDLGRPFPEQDQLRDDESGNGFALRMAGRNGLEFSDLANLMESPGHRYLSARSAKYLAYLFGADPTALIRATPMQARQNGRDVVVFEDCIFTRPYLIRHAWPRICPLCLAGDGYAKSYWELSLATVCWCHRVRLIDECFSCGCPISWRRPGMLSCYCGATYLDQGVDAADEQALELSACFARKLTGGSISSYPMARPLFEGLSLNVLMRLVWSLGIWALMPNGKPVPGKVSRAPNVQRAEKIVNAACAALVRTEGQLMNDVHLWVGAELASDLSAGEAELLTAYLPCVAEIDGAIGRLALAQYRLPFDSEERNRC